jgi:hypothetical protein
MTTPSNILARLKLVKKTLDPNNLANVGYPVFLKNTPIKTGNARSKTVKGNGEIDANYPYAKRLDQGYSRQSPAGMSKPTIAAIRAYIKKTLGV